MLKRVTLKEFVDKEIWNASEPKWVWYLVMFAFVMVLA